MRSDALNLHVDNIRTEITGTKKIMISNVCDSDESKLKGILAEFFYRKSVLRTISNQKSLSQMKVLRRIENQKAFTKV